MNQLDETADRCAGGADPRAVIRARVWAAAPNHQGDATSEVRRMRDEDQALSDLALRRRPTSVVPDAGADLLRHLGL